MVSVVHGCMSCGGFLHRRVRSYCGPELDPGQRRGSILPWSQLAMPTTMVLRTRCAGQRRRLFSRGTPMYKPIVPRLGVQVNDRSDIWWILSFSMKVTRFAAHYPRLIVIVVIVIRRAIVTGTATVTRQAIRMAGPAVPASAFVVHIEGMPTVVRCR